ncbi:MAG: T9SS type A sorting domain-containing protein [Bacteroidales bacterium]|nr:T9SS type A sorting domain-containing protein [Bacteroidales bacterium]
MKRNLLVFMILVAISGFSQAQVVADFEAIPMNVMFGGAEDLSTMTVVPNPDMSGINTSYYVVKFVRDKDGVPWGGFWSALPTPVDVTVNKYVHVKVWKPRISPLKFKLEGGSTGTLETPSMSPQTSTGVWEDIVFDFTTLTGPYPTIVFMPDFEDPLTLTEDIVIYFDDIMVNNDPTPATAAGYIIEDYETIPLNMMLDGTEDLSKMTVVPNPDPSGINASSYVVEFLRDKDGVPWGGFWSPLPTPVDVTDNKYVHVKVWKPRISPIKFKLEGGDAGTLEAPSISPQTSTGVWEDMVFDFSSKTGTYPIIAFMPDFEDPLTLTEDIIIYFDDILVNNNPNPIVEVIMNVDMHGSGLTSGQPVYFSGDFGGIYGSWTEPGMNAANELIDPDNDSIYSRTMALPEGTYQFKFFKGAGWVGGEWDGIPNRKVSIMGNVTLNYIWGVKPVFATFKVDMKGSGLTDGPVSIVGDFGGLYGIWSEPGFNPYDAMAPDGTIEDSIYSITMTLDAVGTYQFKFFKGLGWITGEWDGDPNRSVDITSDTTFATFLWGVRPDAGFSENELAGKVTVYPVPFNNYLNVKTLVDLKSICIFSAMGQRFVKMENPGVGTITVNTSQWSTGLYFVTFYPKSGIPYTLKTMKY